MNTLDNHIELNNTRRMSDEQVEAYHKARVYRDRRQLHSEILKKDSLILSIKRDLHYLSISQLEQVETNDEYNNAKYTQDHITRCEDLIEEEMDKLTKLREQLAQLDKDDK